MKSKLLEKLIKDKTDFCVKVSNNDERDKILSLFDSYEDIRWVNGYKPMEIKHYNYPYFICLRNGKTISYYWKKCNEAKEIKFNDLFYSNSYKQEVHITRKGQEVHAILKENDKVTKHTVAKCHPEDEFDFKVGSKLAYDRLFKEDEVLKANKLKHKFKVGDKVRIRQWNDMLEEYKLNEYGNIDVVTDVFFPDMKYLCGEIATIKAFGVGNYVCLKFENEVNRPDYWAYSTEMLELYIPRVARVGEYVKILENDKIVQCVHDTEYNFGKIFEDKDKNVYHLKPEEYEILDDYVPPFNCRFVVLKNTYGLTKGKIYEIKDGKFIDDDGGTYPICEEILNEEDLKKYFRPLDSLKVEDSEDIIIIKN